MQITVPTTALRDGLKAVGHAVSKRAGLPALSGVRLAASEGHLVLEATDLEITIRRTIAEATCVDVEPLVLPCAVLKQAAETFTGEAIEITTAPNGTAELRCAQRSVRMRILPAEDFPVSRDCRRTWARAEAGPLVDSLSRVAVCASRDEARPVLTGIYLTPGTGAIECVTTDSYRLGYVRVPAHTEASAKPVLMPARLASIIGKVERKTQGEVILQIRDGAISLTVGPTRYTTRLIAGEFPNWAQLIPERNGRALATFDAAELAEGVRGVGVFAQTGTPIRFACSEGGVELTAGTQDIGEATERLGAARFEPAGSDQLTVAFNPGYVVDALKFLDAGEVRMWALDGLKAAVFANGVPEECLYLLMPVRI